MKKLLLVGTAVLLMATETAHAQANSYFGPPSGGATVCSAHQYIADDKAHLLNRAQDSWGWVRWELPSEVPSILAEAWFSECRGLLREVGQTQSSGHCSPVRGSNSRQTARRAWTPRLLTTNDQNIPNQYRCAAPGNGDSARIPSLATKNKVRGVKMTIPANTITVQALAHRFMDVIDDEKEAQPSIVILALIRTLASALKVTLQPKNIEQGIEMVNQKLRREMYE